MMPNMSAPMSLGVSPHGSDRAATLAFTDDAVSGGIGTLWLGDGLFRRPDFAGWRGGMDALVELAWLAGRYPATRIGISAAVLPVRDIDGLVRQAATLDQLTEGGFVLAVTAGFWADELVYRGVPPERRGTEFRARLDALRAGLAGDLLGPAPHTPGGPPLWLAGGRPTLRLAARLGLPYQASQTLPDELAPLARLWRDLGGGLLAHRVCVEAGSDVPDSVRVARHALTGSGTELLDGIAAYRNLGVGDLSMVLGHDDASAQRTLDVLLTDVVPHL